MEKGTNEMNCLLNIIVSRKMKIRSLNCLKYKFYIDWCEVCTFELVSESDQL